MANQEHLDILKQGVDVWNRWKENHPEIDVDLSQASLRKAILRGINLSGTNLIGADLTGADLAWAILNRSNLSHADLSESNLTLSVLIETNLSEATLRQAGLTLANLSGVTLMRADLSRANFDRANLIRVDLREADLTEAFIGYTAFGGVDLNGAKGLETMYHRSPSHISIDTIYRSRGTIPETFLRGAGVPETFITNMRALIESMSPIDYYTCFISYSSQDQAFADRLYADLRNSGVRCWFAPEDMKIGDKIRVRIDESIRLYDKLLLVLSEHSVKSEWVEHEVEMALAKERQEKRTVLFPIRLDDTILEMDYDGWPALIRNTRHIGDFTKWKHHDDYQRSFERLLRDLKAEA